MAAEMDEDKLAEALFSSGDQLSSERHSPAPQRTPVSRYADFSGRDEYDHQILTHRADLESIDNQIAGLGHTIELEQQRLSESKAALDASYKARARLLHLRAAMLKFILELEEHAAE